MAKKVSDDEEEYEFSEAVESAIKLFWPESLKPGDPRFPASMIHLQLAMLKAHAFLMCPSDRQRALRTVIYLKSQLKGEDTSW